MVFKHMYLLSALIFSSFITNFADSPPSQELHIGSQYLPVVLVAGINSDYTDMQPTEELIRKHMPGVYIKNVNLGLGRLTSFWNMYDQAKLLAQTLYEDYNLRNGCNIIAHSQGGLTARYFIQRFNYPRVYNLITWGTPHRGVCGTPSTIDDKYIWLNFMESYASYVLYLSAFQQCVSFAGYWNDPIHYRDYLTKCCFLPYLNNEIEHEYTSVFKENLLKLDNFVMVNSTQEEIVEPAISCHFGFYIRGSMSETESLLTSDLYNNDALGLKTLYESGRLHFKETNCPHFCYQENEENFIKNTMPFLTQNTYNNQATTRAIISDKEIITEDIIEA